LSTSQDFYSNLKTFSDFNKLGDNVHYSRVPDDWFVVIADIRGSTKAIEEGRYQDVNTIGAASIAAVQGVWKTSEIPFVFGGDGASFLVPPSMIERVRVELLRLRNFSQSIYSMELRLGCVSVSEVSAAGLPIEVAKFSIAKKKSIALMRGGGLTWAENKIKSEPDKYCWADTSSDSLAELKGLSCRWQPLQSQKGAVVSILVKPRTEDPALFNEILQSLSDIIDGGFHHANPVSPASMKYKTLRQTFAAERKYFRSFYSRVFLNRVVEMCLSIWAFRHRLPFPLDITGYTAQIPSHSDYRKFDDMLRMVLDCSEQQIQDIQSYLASLYEKKLIYFGFHQSTHALMTCLVDSLKDGGHIHFIDGGGGGYAMAAKSLKEQISRA
jgi:hypothetical protein